MAAKTKATRKYQSAWFVAVRGSYLPANAIGMAIHTVYVLYLGGLMAGWWLHNHDLWQLLTIVVPLSVAAAMLTQYVASRHAR